MVEECELEVRATFPAPFKVPLLVVGEGLVIILKITILLFRLDVESLLLMPFPKGTAAFALDAKVKNRNRNAILTKCFIAGADSFTKIKEKTFEIQKRQ